MSKIIVDTIESTGTTVTVNDGLASGAINAGTNAITAGSITGLTATSLTSGTLANERLAAGTIVQVKYASKTDEQATTSTTYVDIVDLSVTITPTSTSSKILLIWSVVTGQGNNTGHTYLVVARDSTDNIFIADTDGNKTSASNVGNMPYGNSAMQILSNSFLDSPSTTSATTYKMRYKSSNGSSIKINRSDRDTDSAAFDGRACSSFIVMEVKA